MIKRPEEMALMAESGRLLASVFERLDRTSLMGLSTLQIDEMVEHMIVRALQATACGFSVLTLRANESGMVDDR
ncbi:hypothetical protein [Pseudomonas sp. T1.Ur]|uniref:hypothetical protein n=1 Tax=Pseudomonas sp. T1.Ur TaxID=2928704 RepID=UPI00201E4F61|nr:hypothetical protein [Pseudomonas sp. T1.Ur]MCL6701641.1 hypothetical protein [Pseudomonas sp. T1.Ur]